MKKINKSNHIKYIYTLFFIFAVFSFLILLLGVYKKSILVDFMTKEIKNRVNEENIKGNIEES